jgi:hypothetical protein
MIPHHSILGRINWPSKIIDFDPFFGRLSTALTLSICETRIAENLTKAASKCFIVKNLTAIAGGGK